MKFKFKIQQYQTEAVEQTVNVFAGQPSKTNAQYRRDLGKTSRRIVYDEEYVGWRNADVELSDKQLLDNIKQMQVNGNIPQSKLLSKPEGLGACSLDIVFYPLLCLQDNPLCFHLHRGYLFALIFCYYLWRKSEDRNSLFTHIL